MRLKWLGLVFPIGVLGLLAVERLATCLLGSFPASPALWAMSIELRSVFEYSTRWLDVLSGGLMSLQFALIMLLGLALTTAMSVRRWEAVSFLVNHVLLILVGGAALMATGGTIASANGSIAESSGLFLAGSQLLSTIHYPLLAFGVFGCAACHYLFLRQSFAGQRAVTLAMRELAFNLEGRRAVR